MFDDLWLKNATEFEFYWDTMFVRSFKQSSYFSVYGGIDDYLDCRNDYFFLKSKLFLEDRRGGNPGQVKYFEVLLNGSKNLLAFNNPFPVEIKYLSHSKHARSTIVDPVEFGLDELDAEEYIKTEDLAKIALFALVDEKIAFILHTASFGNNFINLFKILETVTSDFEAASLGFALNSAHESLLKNFTYTANNPVVSGVHSRHGINQNKQRISTKTSPMSLSEGHELVKNVFLDYLKFKVKHFSRWV